jgi:hypothetical protein
VVLPTAYALRSPAGIQTALAKWNPGQGGLATEQAVLRALRWLKLKQMPDGSWPLHKSAMTAFAVLAYLAHGETPGASREFGDTVRRGIEFLVKAQPANGLFPGNYEHPIATYALCEAYGMTMNPDVRLAAEKGVAVIIRGQHVTGGWDYGMRPGDRDDTSVMGWSAQALIAARNANVCSDPVALKNACRLAVKGFQKNAAASGGFGYTGPGAGGLSGVGTLCLQLLDADDCVEVSRTLALMDAWRVSWDAPSPAGNSQYYFYYTTQARFNAGGQRWQAWNDALWPAYVKAQQITRKSLSGCVDADGQPQETGWWVNGDNATDRPVMDTCLALLQLMVCYRYSWAPATRPVVDRSSWPRVETD